ncbi:hypothetical protein CDAR_592091 [Caerostris darwini]|uniref:Uncharacterized protein n=1 Tax=Caerostris darwini TaxID=1538125 RepID=A0AAV4W2Y5_9ARAC|nr:hypothetical protein CDAR_592091 [Caerostris darwini]
MEGGERKDPSSNDTISLSNADKWNKIYRFNKQVNYDKQMKYGHYLFAKWNTISGLYQIEDGVQLRNIRGKLPLFVLCPINNCIVHFLNPNKTPKRAAESIIKLSKPNDLSKVGFQSHSKRHIIKSIEKTEHPIYTY